MAMRMKLSLSVRIAEAPCKTRLTHPVDELVRLAVTHGYGALCMRASAAGVQSERYDLERIREMVDRVGLPISMVTADFDVPVNNNRGPDSLRAIAPSLDVAETLGCDLIRVCLKREEDIPYARRAADEARERNIRLAHQCHTTTIFERVSQCVEVLRAIGRDNFGLIYEPANLMLCGELYDERALRVLRPYVMNVYLQNHRLAPEGPVELETWCLGTRRFHHLPIWETGGVDFDAVMRGLEAIEYQGYVTVHQAYGELMGPEEAASQSARYLQSFGLFSP
jgi:sugar phosphate isomerase/epimerase